MCPPNPIQVSSAEILGLAAGYLQPNAAKASVIWDAARFELFCGNPIVFNPRPYALNAKPYT